MRSADLRRWHVSLSVGFGLALLAPEGRAYTVEAGGLNIAGSENRNSSSTVPFVSWDRSAGSVNVVNWVGAANAASGTATAYVDTSVEAAGTWGLTSGTYAFVEETIRLRRDLGAGSPWAYNSIGTADDGWVTVRLSFSGGDSILAVEQPEWATPATRSRARAILSGFLGAQNVPEAVGGGGVRVTTGDGGGQIITGPAGHSRWGPNYIELDIPEEAISCDACWTNVTARGRIEAEFEHGAPIPTAALRVRTWRCTWR